MHRKILYLLVSIGMLPTFLLLAQPVDNSPFSSFGIGNLHNDNLAYYQGFSDLSASFLDLYHLNIKNPASYSFMNAAAFEVGISARYSQFNDETRSAGLWNGNLDYIALGFPTRNPINASLDRIDKDYAFGMAFFLKPHSTVGYNISSQIDDPDLGRYQKNYEGNGGTYKLMWGNSIRYKDFSFGANMGYLFGNINFNENIFFEDFQFAFENRNSIDYNVNGFIWDAGFLYNWFINEAAYKKDKKTKTKILNIGLYGNSAHRFYTINDIVNQAVFEEAGRADTIFSDPGVRGQGTLPAEFGFGATYMSGNELAVGFNFEYGQWSKYKNSVRDETLSDSWKLSLGGLYRPDAKSFSNYFKRVAYKFGVFYQNDPQVIENVQVTDTGVNLGASFPFYYQRKISHINAAFQFGIRGTGTPIQENYGKITVGFTFNDDQWFIKRKYN